MINKVFIPNRGEIAVRIIKTAKKLGIKTVVALWCDDAMTLPAKMADDVYWWEQPLLSATYLNPEQIIAAAVRCGADAVHPGYGFLSENFRLAEACAASQLTFIGPKTEHLRQMGDKTWARQLALSAGIPVLKGWDDNSIFAETTSLPYPLLIKAAMGGGGKAMHVVHSPGELRQKLTQAQGEARRYFGDERVFVERYIAQPRHIEVQLLADGYGHVIHLGERECSIQRRHQKIVEETPAPNLPDPIRRAICLDAVLLAQSIGYINAGTIEFLLDEENHHYFLEMNTRIQVEHAVTEEVTGIDLVAEQFRIANGEALSIGQSDVHFRGHAIETRIYAEDPQEGFAPSPGPIACVEWPQQPYVRIDTAVGQPLTILPDFDPMLAKVITWGSDRQEAIDRHLNALDGCALTGINHNVGYLSELLNHPKFRQGTVDTHFCDIHSHELLYRYKNKNEPGSEHLVAFALWKMAQTNRSGQPDGHDAFFRHLQAFRVDCFGREYTIGYTTENGRIGFTIHGQRHCPIQAELNGHRLTFGLNDIVYRFWLYPHDNKVDLYVKGIVSTLTDMSLCPHYHPAKTETNAINGNALSAPIPGRILKVNVKPGEQVKKGHTLVVLEAMKMENHLKAWKDATVQSLAIDQGQTVKANQLLLTLEG
ncbi:MAG: biotin carboxylase N-terminal domain-containing protein [Breznakibacter sp.]